MDQVLLPSRLVSGPRDVPKPFCPFAIGAAGRSRRAGAGDIACCEGLLSGTTHLRDTSGSADLAPRPSRPPDHVGCHPSRSMR